MSERGRELVDGHGAERVVGGVAHEGGSKIRRATTADCKLLWELANDPAVRASAFSPASIPWEDHVAWFESKVQAPSCHMLIGEAEGAVAGQVRVDERSEWPGRNRYQCRKRVTRRGVWQPVDRLGCAPTLRVHHDVAYPCLYSPAEHSLCGGPSKRLDFNVRARSSSRGTGPCTICVTRGRKNFENRYRGRIAMTSRATQAELLEQHIAENRASQEVDLASWIFGLASVGPSDHVLETLLRNRLSRHSGC